MNGFARTAGQAAMAHTDGHEEGHPFQVHWIVLAGPALRIVIVGLLGFLALKYGPRFVPTLRETGPFWIAVATVVGVAIVESGPFLQKLVYVETTDFRVFEDRVVIRTGWLDTSDVTVMAGEIVGVNLRQSVWQRAVGCGDIVIETRGVEQVGVDNLADVGVAQRLCRAAAGVQRAARAQG